MRQVTHQTISEELSKTVLLPCVFTLHPSSSTEVPRVKWTKVWGQRGSDGLQKEQSVLVARDNVVKVALVFCHLDVLPSRCFSHVLPPAGEEGLPGTRDAAWLQRKQIQRQSGPVRVALQWLWPVPLRDRCGHQRRARHGSLRGQRWVDRLFKPLRQSPVWSICS